MTAAKRTVYRDLNNELHTDYLAVNEDIDELSRWQAAMVFRATWHNMVSFEHVRR